MKDRRSMFNMSTVHLDLNIIVLPGILLLSISNMCRIERGGVGATTTHGLPGHSKDVHICVNHLLSTFGNSPYPRKCLCTVRT